MTDAAPQPKRAKLVGFDNFVRNNPMSDKFDVMCFHHLEFLCGDAKSIAKHFCTALGFRPIATSNMMTVIKIIKRKGDKGHPCRMPDPWILEEVWPLCRTAKAGPS